MKNRIIPIFIPHMGCPNDCVFCNQRKITGINTDISPQNVTDILTGFNFVKENTYTVAFYGGSFTALPIDLQFQFLRCAQSFIDQGLVNDIRLSTRPDCINEEILEMLSKFNISLIELGAQSMDSNVLKLSRRGHDVDAVYRAVSLMRSSNVNFGLQQMIGLPGEDMESFLESTRIFSTLKPSTMRIYPTLVISGTELENLLNKNLYTPPDMDTAVERAAIALSHYEIEGIKVIRIGLQASEDLNDDRNVIAGPYHPSFGQKVYDFRYKAIFDSILETFNSTEVVSFYCNNRLKSSLAGLNGATKTYLMKKFNIKRLSYYEKDCAEDIIQIESDLDSSEISFKNYIKSLFGGAVKCS